MSDEWWVMEIEWRKLSDQILLPKQALNSWPLIFRQYLLIKSSLICFPTWLLFYYLKLLIEIRAYAELVLFEISDIPIYSFQWVDWSLYRTTELGIVGILAILREKSEIRVYAIMHWHIMILLKLSDLIKFILQVVGTWDLDLKLSAPLWFYFYSKAAWGAN